MNPALGLAAVVFLIIANGFFVAAEFALVAVDRAKVESAIEGGSRRARIANGLLGRLSFHLSGAQLGITVTSLVIGFLVEPAVAELLYPIIQPLIGSAAVTGASLVIAIFLATVVQMVVGELVPKGLAIARPETTVYLLGPLVRVYGIVFGPLIRLLRGAANRTVRLMGVEPTEELSHVRTLAELQILVSVSAEGGELDGSASKLLTRSIRFEGKSAEDVLVPRMAITALRGSDSVEELVVASTTTGHSRFLVYGKDIDDVLGSVHVRTVHSVPRDQRRSTLVSSLMRPVLALPESRDLADVLFDLRREKTHLAVVVDEYGGTAGIITLEDILEEIVGEIGDEHDRRIPSTTLIGRRKQWSLSGGLHPDEVADQIGCVLPEGEYETFAGFLLVQLGHLPSVGETVTWDLWTFEIAEIDRHRIATVTVRIAALDDTAKVVSNSENGDD
ncbi:MAG: hemolysin family protein [Acidimicrobiales bacterium]